MIVLVPSTIALLPSYAGLEDPVPSLRDACLDAVGELVADSPSRVGVVSAPVRDDNQERGVKEAAGLRIARYLLGEVGWTGEVGEDGSALLVVANGSACRSEKAPGHLDERSFGFDETISRALRDGDVESLAGLDEALAEELWCHDAPAFHQLARALPPGATGEVSYSDDPFGVQYWVVIWR
jgi:hypothetical protein